MQPVSAKRRSHNLDLFLLYSPVLVAVLVMLPRLFSPQFGLLDDGKSIITAQNLVSGDGTFLFDVNDSRFRPIYWLSFAALYLSVGESVFWYFLLNTAVLCIATAALMTFSRRLGLTPRQAWMSGILFVLSGSVIENFYTLSKGEWLQVMFIALSLLVITAYATLPSKKRRIGIVSGSALLLLFAMGSKETSVIILPVALAWFTVAWVWSRISRTDRIGWRGGYLLSSIFACLVYLTLRLAFTTSAVETSGYTERFVISIGQLIASGIRWAGWLMRDYLYLVTLFLVLGIVIIRRRKTSYMQVIAETLVWMIVWVAVYLPWNFMTEYYMLPFAFGAAIFAGCVLGDVTIWRDRITRWMGGLSVGLIIITLINNYTSAGIQLTVDLINDRLLTTISRLPFGSLVLINIQSQNEYTDQIQMQLDARFWREDLEFHLFNPAVVLPPACQPRNCFIVTPVVENQPLLTVRMGVYEPTQKGWNDSLTAYLADHPVWTEFDSILGSMRMLAVDLPRLFCAVIETRSFCATPSPLLDTRSFHYGWIVYRLEAP